MSTLDVEAAQIVYSRWTGSTVLVFTLGIRRALSKGDGARPELPFLDGGRGGRFA